MTAAITWSIIGMICAVSTIGVAITFYKRKEISKLTLMMAIMLNSLAIITSVIYILLSNWTMIS